MPEYAGLNIRYYVKDIIRTMDFYNILLGDSATDFYEGHAVYTIKSQFLTLTFIEDPHTAKPICGNYNLFFSSDKEVYDRFTQFIRMGFARSLKVDQSKFGPDNHSFSVNDPNGINWKLNSKDKKINTFKFFNIPRVNSVWDILKPL
jgi:hypothetical protein